ncbi:MAG: N-ethylammeline chlorohydrolase, partial [Hyphomicrobiales bacterium]
MTITVIKNADVVVAWDAEASRHVYLHGADVAFEDGTLRYVGPRYEGQADETVDGSGRMVMPGLVNIHSHPSSEALNKGFLDELGSPALYNSSLYEFMPILRPDAEAVPDCVRVAYSELLLSGVTTLADMSVAHPGWLDLAADSGLRVCLSPMFRSARWFTKNGHVVEYEWDEKAGVAAMEQAFTVIEQAQKHPSGRLFAMVSPSQIDTCSEGLIKDSHAEAKRRGLPWQIHAAQSTVEFHEITRRHGVSPIQWLEKLGVLGDTTIVGHGIFLDDYPRVAWHSRRDLALLAETGTMVAHCPTVFMRRGIALDDFGRYRRAGVRIGLGTDTYPHNMLEEMRHVGYVARMMAENP